MLSIMRSQTVVVGVIFPGCEEYLDAYVRSLEMQSDREFDLCLVNDGAPGELRELFPATAFWIDIDKQLTPAEIRLLLIRKARQEGYKNLIFTDTDDFFSENRVAESKRHLKSFDFVFNEISLVDQKGVLIGDKFLDSLNITHELTDSAALANENFIGLSNSALNLKGVEDFYIPKELIAVDWWLYSVLLLEGKRGRFIPEAITFYRQHSRNQVGIGQKLNPAKLRFGLQVIQRHFTALAEYAALKKMKDVAELSETKLEQVQELSRRLEDADFCRHYIEKVNAHHELFRGWWSEIISVNHYEALS